MLNRLGLCPTSSPFNVALKMFHSYYLKRKLIAHTFMALRYYSLSVVVEASYFSLFIAFQCRHPIFRPLPCLSLLVILFTNSKADYLWFMMITTFVYLICFHRSFSTTMSSCIFILSRSHFYILFLFKCEKFQKYFCLLLLSNVRLNEIKWKIQFQSYTKKT